MEWFTFEELCDSAKAKELGIQNVPTAEIKKRLKLLVDKVLDPARNAFGKPITVDSGYRCERLNKAVNGAKKSQHLRGEAVDIKASNIADNKIIFDIIAQLGNYDQLIWERGNDHFPAWVHVSYREPARNEMLRTDDGKNYYKIK